MDEKEATQQLAQAEQGLEQVSLQMKQFNNQLAEAQASLEALDSSAEAFKLIGNIMVKQPSSVLEQELSERKETLGVRIATLQKQEGRLREKVKELQAVVMGKK